MNDVDEYKHDIIIKRAKLLCQRHSGLGLDTAVSIILDHRGDVIIPNMNQNLFIVFAYQSSDKDDNRELFFETITAWKVENTYSFTPTIPIGLTDSPQDNHVYAVYDKATDAWTIPDVYSGSGKEELLKQLIIADR